MNQELKASILKSIVEIHIELSEDKIGQAKLALGSLVRSLAKKLDLEDEALQASLGIPVCICEDGRGWSTCGGECPVHRPHYLCTCGGCGSCTLNGLYQGCSKKVAYTQMCVRCS